MADPARIDIVADRRVPYEEDYLFLNEDFTGSTFLMHVRAVKDTTGTPLLTAVSGSEITVLYAGSATVAAHVSAGRLESGIYAVTNPTTGLPYTPTDSLLLSFVHFGIDNSLLAALPFPEERGDDFAGWYDVIRTPSGSTITDIPMRGPFTDRAGVTIP